MTEYKIGAKMMRKKVQLRTGSTGLHAIRKRIAHWNSEYIQRRIALPGLQRNAMGDNRAWLIDQLLERALEGKSRGA